MVTTVPYQPNSGIPKQQSTRMWSVCAPKEPQAARVHSISLITHAYPIILPKQESLRWNNGLKVLGCSTLPASSKCKTQVSALPFGAKSSANQIQGPFFQPPIVQVTALFGKLILTGSAALKINKNSKIGASTLESQPVVNVTEEVDEDMDQEELDPNPAQPLILALGLASAMLTTFSPGAKTKAAPKPRAPTKKVALDIDFEEYDALASILRETKEAASQISNIISNPLQDVLKFEQVANQKSPFRHLIERLEMKTVRDVSFLQRLISNIGKPKRPKYDWWTELAEFSAPPAEGTLLSRIEPRFSKYDLWSDVVKRILKDKKNVISEPIKQKMPNETQDPYSEIAKKTEDEDRDTIDVNSQTPGNENSGTLSQKEIEGQVSKQDLREATQSDLNQSQEQRDNRISETDDLSTTQHICEDISRINRQLKEVEKGVDHFF